MIERMKKTLLRLALITVILLPALPVDAQDDSMVVSSLTTEDSGEVNRPAGKNLRKRSLSLKDYNIEGLHKQVELKSLDVWDVVQLIEFLAYRGGLNNIVIGAGVQGLTTKLKFVDVTVGDALEVVLSVNNLAYVIKGGIVTIMTNAEYESIYGISFYDEKEVRIEELRYADAARVATLLGAIKSEIGTVVADPLTGTLILIDTPAKIEEMRAIIDKTDIATIGRLSPTTNQSFTISHADVDLLAAQVGEILTEEHGSVQSDRRTRAIIVSDLPHNIERVANLIKLFDKRPKQVFIEAKILEVVLTDDYQLGINWDSFVQGIGPRFSLDATIRRPILGPENPGIGALTYKTIIGDSSKLDLMVEALKTVGETKVLSNPHVAVIDGEEAAVKVVTDTPFAETSAEITGGDTNFVGEEIVFIEVGVSLTVTPQIGDDGFITMAIRPEISSASYDYQAFRRIPVVQKTYTETTIMVQNGETIIIAGMIQNDKRDSIQTVPFFGSIPILGSFFRSVQDQLRTRELVVFLTPRIITGEEPVLRMKDMKKRPKPLRAVGRSATAAASSGGKRFKPLR
jgi:type II secretory pathway component GspD/PulD (secretin)